MTGRVIQDLQYIQMKNRQGWRLESIYQEYQEKGFEVTFAGFLKALRVARNPSKYRKNSRRWPQGKAVDEKVTAGVVGDNCHSVGSANGSANAAQVQAKYFERANLFQGKK